MTGGRRLALLTLLPALALPAAAEAQRAEVFNVAYDGMGNYSQSYTNLPPDQESATTSGQLGWTVGWRATVPVDEAPATQLGAGGWSVPTGLTTSVTLDGPDGDSVPGSSPEESYDCGLASRQLDVSPGLGVHTANGVARLTLGPIDGLRAGRFFCPTMLNRSASASFNGLGPYTSAELALPVAELDTTGFTRDLPLAPTITRDCLPEAESCTESYTMTLRRVALQKVCRTGAARLTGEPPGAPSPEYTCASDCFVDTCDDGVADPQVGDTVRVGSRGFLRVPISCYGRDCRVALALTALKRQGPVARRRVILARRLATIAVGDTEKVRLRLGPRARRLLPAGSEADVRGVVRLLGGERARVRSTFSSKLKAPRRYR